MNFDTLNKDKVLDYTIHKWSSYSHNYVPENILANQPDRQSSRWSSETNNPPQFLILKLAEPAIACSITFGKYEKTHVCNLRKFKVFASLEEQNFVEILQGGLKNDSNPETFTLKHTIHGQPFPCRFIKIVPLLTWGPSYNFSIWHVKLHGVNAPEVVQPCLHWYYKYREIQAIRLCLKHFRQHNYMEAFDALRKKTNILLEDPILSELHTALVHEGDFEKSEVIIKKLIADDIFRHYIHQNNYKPHWQPVTLKKTGSIVQKPGMRGGHQMCMDHVHNCIYLLGGWNGSEDLADFWVFSCKDSEWTCLSKNTKEDGGPSARSCHKMCIDCNDEKIYTLGRYLDASKRTHERVVNDFYVFDIKSNTWKLISPDVALVGGPQLIFDHQMCYDDESRSIFVFGGRVLTPNCGPRSGSISPSNRSDERSEFSGLYSYLVDTDTWHLLREDSGNAGPQDIRSRIGHSMLLDKKQRRLYIFGGQRSKEYINDFFYYDIGQNQVATLSDGTKKENGLPSGFTQRATINSESGEIYVLSGISKDREKREENMHNSFWVYVIRDNRWTCVYKNEPQLASSHANNFLNLSFEGLPNFAADKPSSSDMESGIRGPEPCPRYAHQLVYDFERNVHYMFGGNPGRTSQPKLRLDDFWSLHLSRLSKSDLLRKCRYVIRKQKFREIVSVNLVAALNYLQTTVSAAVDHDNKEQAADFRSLASTLFGDMEAFESNYPSGGQEATRLVYSNADDAYVERTELFDQLVKYFPEDMTQPSENLLDLIVL
ncbi:muskelin-like isoform X1 [Clavelina lepadiformis]|uniref:muskelin-like isoform X1 n=2 Tax=Clavelina lepadiformis TaxID=159417 RepID=UPI00404304A2